MNRSVRAGRRGGGRGRGSGGLRRGLGAGIRQRVFLTLDRAFEMGATLDRDGLVDDVALDPRGRRQTHLQTTHAADDPAVDDDVIGNDLAIGRFAMVGMGSLVTKDVDDFHLVIGHPARPVGCVCRCGHLVVRFDEMVAPVAETKCPACGLPYRITGQTVEELAPPT